MPRTYTLGRRPAEKGGNRPQFTRRGGGAFARHRSGFSPKQQAIYRRLVDDAWRAICQSWRGLSAATDTAAKQSWYRETLRDKLGVYTSKQLNKSGDFERACATFEEIAGKDIYWQMRVNAAPMERMRRKLKELISEHDINEAYVNATADRMYGTHPSNLNANQLNAVIGELEQHFKRQEAA